MKFPVRLLWCVSLLLGLAALSPAIAAPARAQGCSELIVDGGFELGGVWQLGLDPVTPQYVTYTRHSGTRSLALGIVSGANARSYSSARQLVVIPGAASQVTLTFWFYAMTDSPATTDTMEVVLLDPAGAILARPWYSHNDSRLWNQLSFDLTPWRGQTVQLYFNVSNDGLGGTAAMFLDDVSLTACTGPVTTGTVTAIPTSTPSPSRTPTATAPPGCMNALVNGDFGGGLANWQQTGDPAGVAPVSTPLYSPPYALKLGSLDQNLNGLASIRQLVTVPVGYAQVKLDAWVYLQSQPGAGADYQQIAVLNAFGVPLSVLWSVQNNNPAWAPLSFDVSVFAGQSVFVNFSVNNDGLGGRTAMVVDDVRLLACNPGPIGTPTPTATGTATPVPTGTPAWPTVTPVAPGCVDLLKNAGFEAGWAPWQPASNVLPAQITADPVHSGHYAAQMGSQSQNLNSYSSIRQWVTIPWSRPRVILQFWASTWAESLSGADRQQLALLAPDNAIIAKPWSVLQDDRSWKPYLFELVGVAGQTVGVYFNALNDGTGGRTALYLDDVRMWACTMGAYPEVSGEAAPASAPQATRMTPDAIAIEPAAARARASLDEEADRAGDTPTPATTRLTLARSPEVSVGTPLSGVPRPASEFRAPDLLAGIVSRWRLGWPLVVAAIVAIIVVLIVAAVRRSRGSI